MPTAVSLMISFALVLFHQKNVYFLDFNLSAFFYIFSYFTILFYDLHYLREVVSTYK